MELLQVLTSQLGINEEQAKGGSGLLFKMAKDKLDSGEFGQIASIVPGIEDLIESAPKSGGLASAIGGLTSSLGGGGNQLGNLASLADGFKKLDLDTGMVSKFIPVILSFVQGGDSLKIILEKVFK